jgi:hypothetical protein
VQQFPHVLQLLSHALPCRTNRLPVCCMQWRACKSPNATCGFAIADRPRRSHGPKRRNDMTVDASGHDRTHWHVHPGHRPAPHTTATMSVALAAPDGAVWRPSAVRV